MTLLLHKRGVKDRSANAFLLGLMYFVCIFFGLKIMRYKRLNWIPFSWYCQLFKEIGIVVRLGLLTF